MIHRKKFYVYSQTRSFLKRILVAKKHDTKEISQFLKNSSPIHPKNVSESSLHELQIAQPGDLLWVSLNKLRYPIGAMAFTREQNHFVRYYTDGINTLRKFYELHRPRNQIEALFLDPSSVGNFRATEPYSFRSPWGFEIKFGGHESLTKEHGNQHFGPVSDLKLAQEANRLDLVKILVEKYGLQKYDDPDFLGYKLLIDDRNPSKFRFRVLVVGWQHRIAFLASQKWSLIPVSPHACLGGVVRISHLLEWPGVLDGTFSPGAAQAFFEAYFREPRDVLLPNWFT